MLATHTAWFGLCPVWLGDADGEAPTPIPRGVPQWWFDWLGYRFEYARLWVLGCFAPDAVAWMFWAVRELPTPRLLP